MQIDEAATCCEIEDAERSGDGKPAVAGKVYAVAIIDKQEICFDPDRE